MNFWENVKSLKEGLQMRILCTSPSFPAMIAEAEESREQEIKGRGRQNKRCINGELSSALGPVQGTALLL